MADGGPYYNFWAANSSSTPQAGRHETQSIYIYTFHQKYHVVLLAKYSLLATVSTRVLSVFAISEVTDLDPAISTSAS